jgi:hypothetical protein
MLTLADNVYPEPTAACSGSSVSDVLQPSQLESHDVQLTRISPSAAHFSVDAARPREPPSPARGRVQNLKSTLAAALVPFVTAAVAKQSVLLRTTTVYYDT